MAYDPNVLRRAAEALEAQRRTHQLNKARLRMEVYARQPRLDELDRQLQGTMAQLVSAALRKGDNARDAVTAIRDRNLAIQAERAQLLSALGLTPDALDDSPMCPHCGDSGWKGAKMCVCLKKLCTQEQISELSKLLDLGSQSFETFRMDYYSPQRREGQAISPRENMEMVLAVCQTYANFFGKSGVKNLYLHGAPGLGKTFLSACIARVVSENGFSVVYDTAGNIFSAFEAQKFSKDDEDTREAKEETNRYLNCDLLILDDLGCELTTAFTQATLYTLINSRLTAGKRTVISSNMSPDELRRRYTPQIASRLEGEYRALPFFGEDIRRSRTL